MGATRCYQRLRSTFHVSARAFNQDGTLVLLAPAGFEFPKGDFDSCAARRRSWEAML